MHHLGLPLPFYSSLSNPRVGPERRGPHPNIGEGHLWLDICGWERCTIVRMKGGGGGNEPNIIVINRDAVDVEFKLRSLQDCIRYEYWVAH